MEQHLVCSSCGYANQSNSKFCYQCGHPLELNPASHPSQKPVQSAVEPAMNQPVPLINPMRQPQKSGFWKGLLVGCTIPFIIMFIGSLLVLFLFNNFLSEIIQNGTL